MWKSPQRGVKHVPPGWSPAEGRKRKKERQKERKCCCSAFKHVRVERVEGRGGDVWAKWPKAVGRQRWGEGHTCLKVLQIMKGKKRRAGVSKLHTFPNMHPSTKQETYKRSRSSGQSVGEDSSRELISCHEHFNGAQAFARSTVGPSTFGAAAIHLLIGSF